MAKDTKKNKEKSSDSENTDRVSRAYRESRRDDFLGKTIIFVVIILIIGAATFLVFLGYRLAGSGSIENASIVSISSQGPSSVSEQETHEQKEAKVPQDTAKDGVFMKNSISIVVLNGGAPKGSAGIVADILKTDGFLKATAGNASGDYSGMVVYWKEGNESAAKAVQAALSAKYPSIAVKASDPKNKETLSAPIVAILGK
jgi:cytoskeletal protein RodZ